jgi:hypothetical protein
MHEPIDAEQGGRPMYTRRDALASISAAASFAAVAPEAKCPRERRVIEFVLVQISSNDI